MGAGGEDREHQPRFSATCKTRALAVPLVTETVSFITTGRTVSQRPRGSRAATCSCATYVQCQARRRLPSLQARARSLTAALAQTHNLHPTNLDGEPALPGERGHHRHGDRGTHPVAPGAHPALRLQTRHSGEQFCKEALGSGEIPGSGQAPAATAGDGDRKPPAGEIMEPSGLRREI